jgi:glutathione synthase/RimK-type ligase-like ATP-grasp enzyme
MRIAIHSKANEVPHSTLWSIPWIEFCDKQKIEYFIIDCFSPDVIDKLKGTDVLLWHFSGYKFHDMLFARSVLYSAKKMGIITFPDYSDAWHFDDKIAEACLLKSIQAPLAETTVFFSYKDASDWLSAKAVFPLVAKLRNGSGSNNVKLIRTLKEALKYCRVMFGKGLNSSPNLIFKASSNLKSSRSVKTVFNRAKRIPEFLRILRKSRVFPNEKGYVLFQEFIPNDGYDLKIVVVGNKLSHIARGIRKGDFRASGGGDIFYDRSLIKKNIIDSAFEISDKLDFNCMGFDYVVDNKSGIGKIVEMSYGFSHTTLLKAGGYFDRSGVWYNEPLNAPYEIIKNILDQKK